MDFHDVANIFPMMGDEEYRALVADIKANGLHQPIWTYQGKIIDGRNRYKACAEAGIEPKFQEWDGNGSLVTFVSSLNLNRRHLTSSQKAMVAIEIEKHLAEENKVGRPAKNAEKDGNISVVSGESRAQAAAIVGTNSHYVTDAKRIAAKAPELKEAVLAGTLSIPDARVIAHYPAETRTQVLEKINEYVPGWEDHPNRLQRAIRDVEDKRRADESEAQWKAKLDSGEYERQVEEAKKAQEESRQEYERQLREIAEREVAWVDEMRNALNAPGSEHKRTQLYEAAREVDRQLHQMARASMIFLMRFEDLVGEMFNEDGLLGRRDIPSEWRGNRVHYYACLVDSFFRGSCVTDEGVQTGIDESKGRLEGMLERCDAFGLSFRLNGISSYNMPSIDIEALQQWINEPSTGDAEEVPIVVDFEAPTEDTEEEASVPLGA